MPLDSLIDDAFIRRCVGWQLEFVLWPRRCHYTGKWLWLKRAYLGTSILTGPGDHIFEYRWCERKEYLFLKIKGTI